MTEEEKYPGLVVQGPLQALLLLESAKKHHPNRKPLNYTFRAVRPLFEFDRIFLSGKTRPNNICDLYTSNGEQYIGTQATVSWR